MDGQLKEGYVSPPEMRLNIGGGHPYIAILTLKRRLGSTMLFG